MCHAPFERIHFVFLAFKWFYGHNTFLHLTGGYLNLPTSEYLSLCGTGTILVELDPHNTILEADENNNKHELSVTITGTHCSDGLYILC